MTDDLKANKLQVSGQADLDGGVKVHGPSVLNGPVTPYLAKGDVAYSRDDTGIPERLPIGSAGQILTVASGLPSWASGGGGDTLMASEAYSTDTLIHITNSFAQIDLTANTAPNNKDPHSLFVGAKNSFVVGAGLWFVSMTVDCTPDGANWPVGLTRYALDIRAWSTDDGNRPATDGSNRLDEDSSGATAEFTFLASSGSSGSSSFIGVINHLLFTDEGSAIGVVAQAVPDLKITLQYIRIFKVDSG